MKKSVLLILIFFLLSVTFVSALDVEYQPIKDKVLSGDKPSFLLQIHNTDNRQKSLTFDSISYDWSLDQEYSVLEVDAEDNEEFEISYTPILEKEPGNYGINLIVKTDTDRIERYLPIRVIESKEVLDANIINPTLDVRRPYTLQLTLQNLYDADFKDLTLKITSEFFSGERKFTIGAKENLSLEIPIDLPVTTKEGNYDLSLIALNNKDVRYLDVMLPIVVSRFADVKELSEEYTGFLIYGYNITLRNDGNTVVQKTYSYGTSSFEKMFTSYSPEPQFVERNDELYAEWNYTLNPSQTMNISYKVNYGTTVVVLILAALLIIAGYLFLGKPLTLKKRVISLSPSQGEIGILKIMVSVKNTTNSTLDNITLVDVLPKGLRAPTEFGSHQPETIQYSGENLKLMWTIDGLRPKQEKVFSYKITGRMKATNVLLPRAFARVKRGPKKFLVRSNSAIIRA